MRNKREFLLAAIEDSQGTIRAVDVKVSVLLVGLLAPFSNLGRIFSHISHIDSAVSHVAAYLIAFVFFSLWGMALLSLVMSISAIDNPAKHIASSSKFTGSFYGGGLYRFSFIDSLFNRDIIKAEKDSGSFYDLLPDSEREIENELMFEHMKIIYIREIKLHRLKYAYRFSIAWFLVGLTAYLLSKAT